MNKLRSYSLYSLVAAVAAAGVLAGCGGGGDDAPAPVPAPAPAPAPIPAPAPATSGVPDSASQSVAGLIAYLKALTQSTTADTLEPVDASKLTPPVSDTTEPDVVS